MSATKSIETGRRFGIAAAMLLLLSLAQLSLAPSQRATAVSPTVITVYQAQTPVKLNGVASPGEWSDTPTINDPASGMTYAFKHNSTGVFFMLQWQSSGACSDKYCYGGIEIGNMNNTAPMGSSLTSTIMVLISPSFTDNFSEFVSTAEQTPETVQSAGYSVQSSCALGISGSTYTAECYRPFALQGEAPFDPWPTLATPGSPIEIAFAVGEFNQPGLHSASDMSTYVLETSSQTTTVTSTSSTSASTSSSISSSSSGGASSTASSGQSTSSTISSSIGTSSGTTTSPIVISSSTSLATSRVSTPANLYAEELLVIIVGFTALVVLILRRYERG